jgi:F0F1-type ATP synthase assembly protein I
VVGTGVRVRHQLEKAANSVRSSAKVRDDGLSQAFEFAAGPVVMGGIGWLIDLAAGTGPLFLIVFAVFGVIGSFVSFYYRYQAETARLDEGKPWTRRTR